MSPVVRALSIVAVVSITLGSALVFSPPAQATAVQANRVIPVSSGTTPDAAGLRSATTDGTHSDRGHVSAVPELKMVTGSGSITGHVAYGSMPVPTTASAEVWEHSASLGTFDTYISAPINSSGNFTVTGLGSDFFSVDFRFTYPDGVTSHQFWGGGVSPASAAYFQVTDGVVTTLPTDFNVMPDTTVSGRMTDGSGNPVHGFVTMWDATGTSAKLTNVANSVETRADGTYTLLHAVEGTYRVGFVAGPAPFNPSTGALGISTGFVSQWYVNQPTYSLGADLDVWVSPTTGLLSPITGVSATMGFGFSLPPSVPRWNYEVVSVQNPSETACQCGHGEPVNSATGEFYDSMTDVSIPGVGPEFSITRNYSSSIAGTAGAFGFGWTSLIDAHVAVVDPGPPGSTQPLTVAVYQENGSTVQFTDDGTGNYIPDSARAIAQLAWNGSTWTFTRRGSQIFTFDSNGLFLSISDLNNNLVAASYTGTDITSLTAPGGRQIDLTWSGGHVSHIEDSALRGVDYAYNGSGELTSVTGIDSTVVSYGYDTGHHITTVTKPGGATTTNTYDASYRVTSQTDPIGRVTGFSYSSDSSTVTSPSGAQTTDRYYQGFLVTQTVGDGTAAAAVTYYSYDDQGNVRRITDPLGHIESYTYDSRGNATGESDTVRTTTRTFDSANNPTYIKDPLGRITYLSYDGKENLTSVTNPAGNVQSWTRNSDGTAATSTDGDGKVTSYTYDAAGRLLSTVDPLGHSTSVTYNDAGQVLSSTDGAGKTTTFTVDANGRDLTVTDPNNHTTTYTYDSRGNKTSITDANSNSVSSTFNLADELTATIDALGKTTSYTYSPDGQLLTTTDPNSHTTTNAYDVRGNLLSVTDALSHTTSYTYDLKSERLQTTLPSGATSSLSYNAYGEAVTSTDSLGKVTQYGRDADGEVTQIVDPLNRSTSKTYYGDGRLKLVQYPNSSTESYVYDGRGDTTQFTNADGLVSTYSYDDAKRLTSRVEPGGLTTSYAYDNADRLLTTTRPDGSVSTNTYDDAGQVTNVHESAAGSVDTTIVYNAVGERAGVTDATGTTVYGYSARGQMLSATNASGAVSYGYDNAGQETTVTYPGSKVVTYAYDAGGNMTSATDWNSKTTSYTWTPNNQLSTRTGPDTIVETHLYDADGQLSSITSKKGTTQVAKYSYTYDVAGQLITDTTVDPTTTSLAHTYTYDTVSQLKSTKTGSTTLTYTATPGHEITKTSNGDVYSYNGDQELSSLTPTSGAATSFAYDGNGSRTSSTVAAHGSTPAATTTMTYSPNGSLASVVVPGSPATTVSYTTASNGLRQTRTKSRSTSFFLWNVNASVPQLLSDGAQWYVYGAERTPLAQIDRTSGTTVYLHSDLIGSVRLLTTSTGSTAGANTFDPFGKRTVHTGTSDSSIGFAGSWTDVTTGLVYMQARDYDPRTSQFLTVDPALLLTHDPYAYVSNSPLASSDPIGLWDFNNDFLYPLLTTGITGQISNALVGFGDGASFGLTHLLTNALVPEVDCQIDGTGAYVGGSIVGLIASTIATAGLGAGIGGAAEVSTVARSSELIEPSAIRFSQSSVNDAAAIEDSMRASGWVGDPIDVVRMPDGGLTSMDNTRLLAAKRADINVNANVHDPTESLPPGSEDRFGDRTTWGEAILDRIGGQNSGYRAAHPNGSPWTGWTGN